MADTADSTWQKWHDELEAASKAKGFETWEKRARKIVKRYRDERADAAPDTSNDITGARFNILWSNVQTLLPALFAKSPKPVVERRYLDKDDIGRTASVILERALLYELDDGCYQSAIRKAVLDRLLPGRGVVWVRYEPKFTAMPGKTQEDKNAVADVAGAAPGPSAGVDDDRNQDGRAEEQVASESTPIDYVDWQDFMTSPARTWEEVWWIAKRVYMTREELEKRFGAVGKLVPLDWTQAQGDKQPGTQQAPETGDKGQKRARVIEIWDRTKRKVIWIAEKWNEKILDTKDDPLQLEGFWPVPKPLFASTTNDSLIPIPDYYEYQDQANELDDLTQRISALTKCIKNAGVYDASIDELKRMFDEGFENKLVPCDNMAEFTSKAGATGMGHIWLLPIKDMAEVLIQLYAAREQVKQSLYEITGISDIVRGQAGTGKGNVTATEQRIKGQFASMRLNDMQAEVARFCRDTLKIMGEIIAEHFDPKTLYLVSGFEQYAKEQWPPQNNPMMGHNGGPPMQAMPEAPPGMGAASAALPGLPGAGPQPMMQPDPAMMAQAKAQEMFTKATELLRNDKLRGFRIDIETDSIIEPDQQQMQQARTELMGAISQFLPQAMEAGQAAPELRPLLARLLMFFLRGFKASRDIEAAFEQFIDDMQKQAQNPQPKPPSPEELQAQADKLKAETEIAKQKMEAQRAAEDFQREQQAAAVNAQMEQQKQAADMEMKEREFAMKEREMQLQEQIAVAEHQRKLEELAAQQQLAQQKATQDSEAAQREHTLKLEQMEASDESEQKKIKFEDERQAAKESEKTGTTRPSELKPLIEHLTKAAEKQEKFHAELVATLTKPKKIMRGSDGRAVGVQ